MAHPGRRPRVESQPAMPETEIATPLTETSEFKIAVKAAVDDAMGPILAALAQLKGQEQPQEATAPADTMFRQLALAIAEISDQGTNRKRVAPEILAARARAHERMVDAILSAKRAHEQDDAPRPLYRAIAKMYLNERFIEPWIMDPSTKRPKPVEFYWSGPPNPAMRPLNEPATEIFRHYSDSLGSLAVEKEVTASWVTAGGLVIKGEGPASLKGRHSGQKPVFDDDLAVVDNNDPESPFISVLGTVQPPARRGAAGIGKGAV